MTPAEKNAGLAFITALDEDLAAAAQALASPDLARSPLAQFHLNQLPDLTDRLIRYRQLLVTVTNLDDQRYACESWQELLLLMSTAAQAQVQLGVQMIAARMSWETDTDDGYSLDEGP